MTSRRLAIAVGDTAGHVMPALAVAEAYSAMGPVDIRFIAAGEGSGHSHIERAGYPLDYVPGSPIARANRLAQLAALSRVGSGVIRSRALLVQHGIRLVIGTGGYGSASALLAARSLGLTTALVEPNAVPGLANRLLGRVVHRAYVAFEETVSAFPPGRTVVSGVPLRRTLTLARPVPAGPLLPHLRLLVMSGSRGMDFLGDRVPALAHVLKSSGLSPEVWHQGGSLAPAIQNAYDELGIPARVDSFIDDVSSALGWGDFAIARSGAGTIAELAAAGIPTLFVPLADAANDHQTVNAVAMVSRGAGLMTTEAAWEADGLARRVLEVVRDADAWRKMSTAMRTFGARDAAADIVRDCEALMEGRW